MAVGFRLGGLTRLFVQLVVFFGCVALLLRLFAWIPVNSPPAAHPIPYLLARAEDHYSQLAHNQSATLQQAYHRYVAAHGRRPPPRFDEWFHHAQAVRACSVDRFDELYASLEIWWALSPAEIRRRTDELAGGNALGLVAVRSGKVLTLHEMQDKGIDPGPLRSASAPMAFAAMLEGVLATGAHLPNLDMYVNALDEPRVVIPYELRHDLKAMAQKHSVRKSVNELPVFHELDGANPYDIIRQACPPASLARRIPLSSKPGSNPTVSSKYTHRFTTSLGHFLASPRLERETWCDQPDLQDLHATLIRPLSFSYLNQLYPIFSNSKLKGFNDILIPAWFYWDNIQPYDPEEDIEWKNKADNLYWRGSNTGGYSSGLNWIGWMRSRLVSRLNRPSEWGHQDTLFISTSDGLALPVTLPSHNLNSGLTDVAFSKPDRFGDADSLASQRTEPSFRFTGLVPFASNFWSKAVLDMDGTAYSGRFVTLMRSKSAVFKSRLYMEAMEDSLVPWYHFIPVSTRFQELYSLLGYFFGVRKPLHYAIKEGAKVGATEMDNALRGVPHEVELKKVADQGAEWAAKCMRKEDSIVFVHLLALEWGRLCHDKRDELGYVLKDGDSL